MYDNQHTLNQNLAKAVLEMQEGRVKELIDLGANPYTQVSDQKGHYKSALELWQDTHQRNPWSAEILSDLLRSIPLPENLSEMRVRCAEQMKDFAHSKGVRDAGVAMGASEHVSYLDQPYAKSQNEWSVMRAGVSKYLGEPLCHVGSYANSYAEGFGLGKALMVVDGPEHVKVRELDQGVTIPRDESAYHKITTLWGKTQSPDTEEMTLSSEGVIGTPSFGHASPPQMIRPALDLDIDLKTKSDLLKEAFQSGTATPERFGEIMDIDVGELRGMLGRLNASRMKDRITERRALGSEGIDNSKAPDLGKTHKMS